MVLAELTLYPLVLFLKAGPHRINPIGPPRSGYARACMLAFTHARMHIRASTHLCVYHSKYTGLEAFMTDPVTKAAVEKEAAENAAAEREAPEKETTEKNMTFPEAVRVELPNVGFRP